jgi:hypothetical protein
MIKHFNEAGISFRYPADWTLEREDSDNGWTVSLQSPNTAFIVVSCDETMPQREEVAEVVLEALQAEYPGLDAEACVETLAGQMAVGHNIQFISLDLTNTCWTHSFYTDAGTVLVMCQTNDLEIEKNEPILRAICASLTVEEQE